MKTFEKGTGRKKTKLERPYRVERHGEARTNIAKTSRRREEGDPQERHHQRNQLKLCPTVVNEDGEREEGKQSF